MSTIKGYTNPGWIEEHLGRQLTVGELDRVDRLIQVAEGFIDDWCGRSWAGGNLITDERYGIEEKMHTVKDIYLNPVYLMDQYWLGGQGPYGVYWYGDVQLKGRPVDRVISVRDRPSTNLPAAPTTAPVLTGSNTGGFIPSGNYQVAYTWTYPTISESEAGPSSSIFLSPGTTNSLTVSIPALPVGVSGANYYITQPEGTNLYLANQSPMTLTNIAIFSLPGTGQPQPPKYELTYTIRNLQDGRIWIPDFITNDYVWVTYSTLDNVPADIREAASQIVAYWLTRSGGGGISMSNTGPIRSYMLGNDIQVQFSNQQGKASVSLGGIPDSAIPLLMRRKRNVVA